VVGWYSLGEMKSSGRDSDVCLMSRILIIHRANGEDLLDWKEWLEGTAWEK